MDSGDIPIFAMLKSRLGYLSERQKVIAENVANANTPGYAAHALKPFSYQLKAASQAGAAAPASAAAGMAVTQAGHMQAPGVAKGLAAGVKASKQPDSEVTLDGNGVVLEDEMVKLTQARMDYDAAISFYQKSMGLLKMAVRKPGAG